MKRRDLLPYSRSMLILLERDLRRLQKVLSYGSLSRGIVSWGLSFYIDYKIKLWNVAPILAETESSEEPKLLSVLRAHNGMCLTSTF